MSLYLGKQKVQVPKVSKVSTAKLPKAFFDGGGTFYGLSATSMDGWFLPSDTADVTNMSYMFRACSNLVSSPSMDTSKVTNMSNMFFFCKKLTSVSSMDTSKVTNMANMFSYCSALTTSPFMDTSGVTNMSYMFAECTYLSSISAINASSATTLERAFYNCKYLKEIHMYGMKVSFDISYSTKFTESALVEILNNLASVSSTQTLTMGSTNLAKLTDDEKAIATDKGWTLK